MEIFYTRKEVEDMCFQCYAKGLRVQHEVETRQPHKNTKWNNFQEWMTELIDTVKYKKNG